MSRAAAHAEKLRAAVGALVRRIRASSAGAGAGAGAGQGTSWPQLSVLKRLDADGRDGMTTADLARAELITPQAMGGMVAELEEAGLVSRKGDSDDGRRRLISITRAGARALADGRAARQTWLAHAIETRLDAAEQKTLAAAIELLERIAES